MSLTGAIPPAGSSCEPHSSHQFDGWILHEFTEVASTNVVAASLPAWSAARANRQTAGRGRFSRSWVSDEGGLWLSAVVPCLPERSSNVVPLGAGLAVCRCLSALGVSGLRMRWPNDIMVADRKLAGLLIDQFARDRFVIGIGLNVSNSPEDLDLALKNRTARLKDLLPNPPALNELAAALLCELRPIVQQAQSPGMGGLLPPINALWHASRIVELDLDGPVCRGTFAGVNESGELVLLDASGQAHCYDPHQVRHLTEI